MKPEVRDGLSQSRDRAARRTAILRNARNLPQSGGSVTNRHIRGVTRECGDQYFQWKIILKVNFVELMHGFLENAFHEKDDLKFK